MDIQEWFLERDFTAVEPEDEEIEWAVERNDTYANMVDVPGGDRHLVFVTDDEGVETIKTFELDDIIFEGNLLRNAENTFRVRTR